MITRKFVNRILEANYSGGSGKKFRAFSSATVVKTPGVNMKLKI